MSGDSCASYLKKEFQERKRIDKKFSLRSFARFLDLSPSMLSQVMSGARSLSPKTAVKIAKRCGFPDEVKERFLSLTLGADFNTVAVNSKDTDFRTIEMDQFVKISSWKHYAILSLGRLRNVRLNSAWIASRLNISEAEAQAALDDLEAVRLLELKGDYYHSSGRSIRTRSDVPSKAIREFHSGLMDKAKESLNTCPVDARDITAVTMGINKKRMRVVKKRIKDFRRELMKYMSEGKQDEIYALQISLFPLTRTSTH